MILFNLPIIVSSATRNAHSSRIATYGGTLETNSNYLFSSYQQGLNESVKNRMQKYYTNESPYNPLNSTKLNVLICAGTGTTPPQIDDTKLESAILDLSFLGGICTCSKSTVTVSTTWQNNTGEALTINEIGLHETSDVGSNKTNTPFAILTRSVLEQPIVMQDGDSRTFSIAINFDKMLETTTNG